MSTAAPLQTLAAKPKASSNSTHAGLLLQRKCACGSPTASLTGECSECNSKKGLQAKFGRRFVHFLCRSVANDERAAIEFFARGFEWFFSRVERGSLQTIAQSDQTVVRIIVDDKD